MPHAFKATPDHPAVAYLVRLHADIGGKLLDNKKEAARLAWTEAGKPKLAPPVLVTITVKRRRKMDEDNLRTALIPMVNGIFKQGIVEDDSPAFIRYGELIQEKPSPGAHPSVIFEITSLAEEQDES